MSFENPRAHRPRLPHEEFAPRTAWSHFNPFTEVHEDSTNIIDMGTVYFGSSEDTTFTIRNLGGGVLADSIKFLGNSPPFSALTRYYALGPGESVDARIRFTSRGTPGHVYTYVANASTGALCMSQGLGVQVTAEAREAPRPPSCSLSRTSLDFDSVAVGQSKDLTFDLENLGGGTLCGSMTESCADFAVIQNSSYCITPPVFVRVTVRFSPTSTGLKQCTISPGANCPPVTATPPGDGTSRARLTSNCPGVAACSQLGTGSPAGPKPGPGSRGSSRSTSAQGFAQAPCGVCAAGAGTAAPALSSSGGRVLDSVIDQRALTVPVSQGSAYRYKLLIWPHVLLRVGVAEQGVTPPACQRRHWLLSGVVRGPPPIKLILFNTIVTGVLQPPHAPGPTVFVMSIVTVNA